MFYVSVTLMMWAFLSGLLLLAGAHFSATRYALSVARQEERSERDNRAQAPRSRMRPMQKTNPSGVRQGTPASPKQPARWRRRPPTGVAGAVFWLALGFGLLWLLRLAPSGGRALLGWMQLLVGLALISLAVPLAWRLVHQHLLWSLRNKLILTYLLIGLAPAVLFVTLAAISAYIAAGQFSIHLADTRMHQQLDELGADSAAEASRMRDRIELPPVPRPQGLPGFQRRPRH